MSTLIHTRPDGTRVVRLDPKKRVLFLTKDLALIRAQLAGSLQLSMRDVDPAALLDDINTDVMTPAWVCFRHRPEDIALDAYAGLVDERGQRVFPTRALRDGNFQVIVSGQRKGTGSSRETAPQAEKWSGIELVIAASFAPIHERNNINLGQLMGGYELLERLQSGEEIPLEQFTGKYDPVTRAILEAGGLFPFSAKVRSGEIKIPSPATPKRPMTMAEKILASHLVGAQRTNGSGAAWVRPGDCCLVNVDGGYSHEFTTAQVHYFLSSEYGAGYKIVHPDKFAVFEDHLLYADGVPKMMAFSGQIRTLRELQHEFQRHTSVRDYSARDGVSPGICHKVAREHFLLPGQIVVAIDSHTCMGGGSNALAWGVGATEYAALIYSGFTPVRVPESIRFELVGNLARDCTAKDVILHLLLHYARNQYTLNRVMEFGGSGLQSLSPDELLRLEAICDRFEGLWGEGTRPDLASFLTDAPDRLRGVVLRELVALDVEYRRRAGEVARVEDYRAWLRPADAGWVSGLLPGAGAVATIEYREYASPCAERTRSVAKTQRMTHPPNRHQRRRSRRFHNSSRGRIYITTDAWPMVIEPFIGSVKYRRGRIASRCSPREKFPSRLSTADEISPISPRDCW